MVPNCKMLRPIAPVGNRERWQYATQSSGVMAADGISETALGLESLCIEGRVEKAMNMLCYMDQQGIAAPLHIYRSLLETCIESRATAEAKQVCGLMSKNGCPLDSSLGESVVNMLIQRGSLSDAIEVFNELPHRSASCWTAIISGCRKAGQGQNAIRHYYQMQAAGVEPHSQTFVSTLQACGSLADLDTGRKVHAALVRYGYDSDLFVGTALIGAYLRCGALVDAQLVFESLATRDIVLWNSMIRGYAQHDLCEKAMELYTQMQDSGIRPNHRTFVSVLRACGGLAALENDTVMGGQSMKVAALGMGKAIHSQVKSSGYECDELVSSALIYMYASCGSIIDAQQVFVTSAQASVVSWNAMVAGYAQQGQGDKALILFAQMKRDGVSPDDRTFVSLLQACSSLAGQEEEIPLDGQELKLNALQRAKAIHAEAVRSGHASDMFVGSTLVHVYGKCGSVVDAKFVFDKLSKRNVVTWNAMIAGYASQKQDHQVWELYVQMPTFRVNPDEATYLCLLKACSNAGDLKMCAQVHKDITDRGLQWRVSVANTLIHTYGKCGSTVLARSLFDSMPNRSVVTWNAIISAYAQQEEGDQSLQLYAQMLEHSVRPNDRTFVSLLKACSSLADTETAIFSGGQTYKVCSAQKGKAIHADLVRAGYESDPFVGNTLVDMYAKCGCIEEAQHIFDTMSQPDVVSWNALIVGYAQQEQGTHAFRLYDRLQQAGVKPDEATFVCILKACSNSGALSMCRRVHHDLRNCDLQCSLGLGNCLVHAYGKCGSMVDARAVFDSLPEQDVVSWNALIAGYARQGDSKMSLASYEEMQKAGMKPDGLTFLSILAACSHAGLVHEGLLFFKAMSMDHSITCTAQHYVSIIDILGRAGKFEQVESLLSEMRVEPNLALWLSLLGACRKHGNVELGRLAFEGAVKLDARQSAPYMLMSTIYAHARMFDEADAIAQQRQHAGAWKQPGQSWIEYQNKVHTFRAGDDSHQDRDKVCALLDTISKNRASSLVVNFSDLHDERGV